jgi:hypothetical protein
MWMLFLLAAGEIALVLAELGMVLGILLPLGEAAFVDGFVGLFSLGEVALRIQTLRVVLGGLLPGGKRPLVSVLVLLHFGDDVRLLALHGGPPL